MCHKSIARLDLLLALKKDLALFAIGQRVAALEHIARTDRFKLPFERSELGIAPLEVEAGSALQTMGFSFQIFVTELEDLPRIVTGEARCIGGDATSEAREPLGHPRLKRNIKAADFFAQPLEESWESRGNMVAALAQHGLA